MTPKQFIEKALQGGYLNDNFLNLNKNDLSEILLPRGFEPILLDPLAWQAVGKVEGWIEWNSKDSYQENEICWYGCMHRMVDALCEGKSVIDFLETL